MSGGKVHKGDSVTKWIFAVVFCVLALSVPVSAQTLPAPSDILIWSSDTTDICLNWGPVAGVSSYEVKALVPAGLEVTRLTFWNGHCEVYVPPGLYTFQVRSIGWDGTRGVWSAPQVFLMTPGEIPHRPLNFRANVDGDSVYLEWSLETNTTYEVKAERDDSLEVITFLVTGNRFFTTGVPRGIYWVSVRALSGGLASSWTLEAMVNVWGPCPKPDPPTGLIYRVAGNTVTLSWLPSPLAWYYEIGVQGGNFTRSPEDGATEYTEPYVPSGEYLVWVGAQNDCGTSRGRAEVLVRVP